MSTDIPEQPSFDDENAQLMRIIDEQRAYSRLTDPADDLNAVITGQLFLENALTRLLEKKLPRAKAIQWADYDSALKIQVADASGLISPELSRSLKFVGRLRNKFAHDVSKELRGDEGRELLRLLPANCGKSVRELFGELDPDLFAEEWALLRLEIIALKHELDSLLDGERS